MEIVKFTQKDLREFLSSLKLEKLTTDFIIKGVKYCIDKKILHIDIVTTHIYNYLFDITGTEPKIVKRDIYKAVKGVTAEDKIIKFGYEGNLTNRKLFIILLERYGY